MPYVQHRGPRDTTPLQHQVWLVNPCLFSDVHHPPCLFWAETVGNHIDRLIPPIAEKHDTCPGTIFLKRKSRNREAQVCWVDVKSMFWFFFPCRPDRQLQDIVYKMVPFLEERERSDAVHTHYIYVHEKLVIRYFLLSGAVEREQMRNFYKSRGLEVPNPGKPVQPWRSFFFFFGKKKYKTSILF